MKAAYVKAPFQFKIENIQLRDITDDEALVKINICGICGTDMHIAKSEAKEWQPFGHEIVGTVEKVGRNIKHVSKGQKVLLESGSFCRDCELCRNGRVDLCNNAPNIFRGESMGFAEYIIAPKECLVPFEGISDIQASIVEPLGVALDLIYTTGIELNDDVLVIGIGPIGLMALRLAIQLGARNVYAAARSHSKARIELAKKIGAKEVILTDKQDITKFDFPRGGVEKILITASPQMIVPAIDIVNYGGIIGFIGIEYGKGADITFDANKFHFKKMQLRASHAAPALYFPRCIELIKSGVIDPKLLISHIFKLEDIQHAFRTLKDDKENVVKVLIVVD